ETLTVDVRVIAATNQLVETMITDGRFRQDLYYRLRGVTITLPPLRERAEDIPELAHYLMFRFNQQLRTSVQSIAPEALEKLQAHRWPGNVRELQSVIREALIVSTGPVLLPEFLPLESRLEASEDLLPDSMPPVPGTDSWQELGRFVEQTMSEERPDVYRKAIQRFDQLVVMQAMNRANGMQSRASEILGISRPTLRSKLRSIFASVTTNETTE
ncbi:MAG: sigma-54-dependent Fis family transcriptional regulator, partial [Fuerstia sp.]|nr:sigma-54-dependent Fis family transcriptional regulator [Fuerstiella sp.]